MSTELDDLEFTEYDTWMCAKCHSLFVDIEDFPNARIVDDGQELSELPSLEARLYWLSLTEPICEACAVIAGIPPIDKE
jgi:hypothetical protein